MLDLLSQLVATPVPQLIHPREIFMALPSKDKQYQYPRDVQAEVWDRWFSIRDKRNTIIKMNTGSGKTIVGLLILQSCLNALLIKSVKKPKSLILELFLIVMTTSILQIKQSL